MAKTTKGVRLDDELLKWFESQENGSEATREAIRIYKRLQQEFDTGIEFHLDRALKLYRQYRKKVDNMEVNIANEENSEEIEEEVSLADNSEEAEVEIDDLENNLDNL